MASDAEKTSWEIAKSERHEALLLLDLLAAAMRCPADTRVPFPLTQPEMLRSGGRALMQLADLMDGTTDPAEAGTR